MIIIALTGGIGSGKSVVAAMFRDLGAASIDTDQLARDVVAPGTEGLAAIVQRFGPAILLPDGAIDRGRLGQLVFEAPQARLDLEAIVHPRIFLAVGEWLARQQAANTALCLVEIPLLFEVPVPPFYQVSVCVTASREARIARVKKRSGYDDKTVEGILAAQLDPVKKAERADYTIDNSGDLEATRQQVEELVRKLV